MRLEGRKAKDLGDLPPRVLGPTQEVFGLAQSVKSKTENIKSSKVESQILEVIPEELKYAIKQRLNEFLENLQRVLERYGLKRVRLKVGSETIIIERGQYIEQAIVYIFNEEKGVEEFANIYWLLNHRTEIEKALKEELEDWLKERLGGELIEIENV